MKERKNLIIRMLEQADLPTDTIPGLPVVEVAGERRVLIENHLGVTEYGREMICIKVKYGFVRICGKCLELSGMTKDRLVIIGRIDAVNLIRRNGT